MPGDSAKFYLFELHPGLGAWAAPLVGAVGLAVVAPWVTRGVVNVELAMARSLLGPTAEQRSAARITRRETSRSAAVDSAEAERRRIERDLHDGAQQRLVALAANLGAARELLRAGLTRILIDAGEEVVATVGAADELMTVVERHQPDLCIVDVRMPRRTRTTGSGRR